MSATRTSSPEAATANELRSALGSALLAEIEECLDQHDCEWSRALRDLLERAALGLSELDSTRRAKDRAERWRARHLATLGLAATQLREVLNGHESGWIDEGDAWMELEQIAQWLEQSVETKVAADPAVEEGRPA